jgi:hypothetical protein
MQFGDVAIGAHHLAALASVAASALTGQGHAYTLLLLSTESTTPFVNLRWLLDKAGLRSSASYLINGILLMMTWLMGRIVFMAIYFFPLAWRHSHENYLV